MLIDDERLARVEMAALLAEAGGCTVVAEAANVPDALRLIEIHQPDVLFLDINMPGADGFSLLDQLEQRLKIVFVTAYDKHAVRAFTVQATDYLMKPVRPERLAATLELLRQNQSDARIFIPSRDGGAFIDLSDIFLVRAYDHYVRLWHGDQTAMLQEPLKTFVERLPSDRFFSDQPLGDRARRRGNRHRPCQSRPLSFDPPA